MTGASKSRAWLLFTWLNHWRVGWRRHLGCYNAGMPKKEHRFFVMFVVGGDNCV